MVLEIFGCKTLNVYIYMRFREFREFIFVINHYVQLGWAML